MFSILMQQVENVIDKSETACFFDSVVLENWRDLFIQSHNLTIENEK